MTRPKSHNPQFYNFHESKKNILKNLIEKLYSQYDYIREDIDINDVNQAHPLYHIRNAKLIKQKKARRMRLDEVSKKLEETNNIIDNWENLNELETLAIEMFTPPPPLRRSRATHILSPFLSDISSWGRNNSGNSHHFNIQ